MSLADENRTKKIADVDVDDKQQESLLLPLSLLLFVIGHTACRAVVSAVFGFFRLFDRAIGLIGVKRLILCLEPILPGCPGGRLSALRRWILSRLSGLPEEEFESRLCPRVAREFRRKTAARCIRFCVPALALTVATFSVFEAQKYTLATKVYIDGSEVAVISGQDEFYEAKNEVERYLESVTGREESIEANIVFEKLLIEKNMLEGELEKVSTVLKSIADSSLTPAYGLYVDGTLYAVNENKEILDSQVNRLLDVYAGDDGLGQTAEFIQDVTVRETIVPLDKLMSVEEVAEVFSTKLVAPLAYTIDNMYLYHSVCEEFGIAAEEAFSGHSLMGTAVLAGGLENVTPTALSVDVPLSVKVFKTVQYEEEIPYSVERVATSKLYTDQTSITQKGVNGKLLITAELYIVDGIEISRTVVNRQTVADPVPQIVQYGTTARPLKSATGYFRWPISGPITSKYGYRSTGFHTGIDIGASYGKTIVAADGGTIEFAGWLGNYGLLVRINHGNGYVTYYAHCSSLLVSSGQKVAKGEAIAKVGSTGNSTGNHLHFEIRVKGVTTNPISYLP